MTEHEDMREHELAQQPMGKTHDYTYDYRGLHTPGAKCRIRVYERAGDVPVVIATELPDNDNTSVTNIAEYLAAEIIARHFPHRFEEENPVIWIEHDPPIEAHGRRGKTVEYSLVEFDSYTPRQERVFGRPRVRIGDPAWRHLREEEVEELLGQKPG
jgi:hypothetical protein